MYVSLGTDLVVDKLGLANAQKSVSALKRENSDAKKRYEKEKAAYDKKVKGRAEALKKYEAAKKKYDEDLVRYKAALVGRGTSNAVTLANYKAALALWQAAADKEYAYGQAVSHQARVFQEQTRAALAKYNAAPPPGYTGCLDPRDQAAYVELCKQQSQKVVVKGVGAIVMSPSTPACAYAGLPICSSVGPRPPPAGPKPPEPVLSAPPAAPVAPKPPVLGPEPVPPKPPLLKEVPRIMVKEAAGPVEVPVPEPENRSFAVVGLLALAVVAGGGAYYVFRKKKPQS